ncbi:hypothetical protein Hanom_Chr01g00091061 [Helianthus anomalus]
MHPLSSLHISPSLPSQPLNTTHKSVSLKTYRALSQCTLAYTPRTSHNTRTWHLRLLK